jgi:hypothetical protein
MAWKVNSVNGRPSRPGSNFMVGTQSPKSRPSMVDFWTPLLVEEEAAVEDDAAGAMEAGTVTVTRVVAAHAVTGAGSGVGVEVTVTVRMQEVEDSRPWLVVYFCVSNL